MPFFTDRVEIADKAARITRDGYLVADALVGRANNIQEYRAAELGLDDRAPDEIVRVFRPEAVVFSKDALATLAHRPITLDHPSEGVTADNWRRLAVGDVGGDIVRDGEFIRVPIKIMDAGAVASVQTDRRQFSLGYAAGLDLTPGEFEGKAYDAALSSAAYNHLAACRHARGGADLTITDERPDDRRKPADPAPVSSASDSTGDRQVKKIVLDGLQVDLSDADAVAVAIEKLQGQVKDAVTQVGTLTADLVTANTTIQTRDGEIVALNAKLKDAEVTPERLQQMADERAKLIDDAKKVDPAVVTDGKTVAEIKKAAVTTRLGDAAKDMADAAIDGAFRALVGSAPTSDPVRGAIQAGVKTVGDAKGDYLAARDATKARLRDAYKTPANHSAAAA